MGILQMRHKSIIMAVSLLLLLTLIISGCGGGSSKSSPTTTPVVPKFTQSELVGKTIFSAIPSSLYNLSDKTIQKYSATTFREDGTVIKVSNLPSSAQRYDGIYSIDNSTGVLTITFGSDEPVKYLKTTTTIDSYNSFSVQPTDSKFIRLDPEKWFFDQALGASQALACAIGATIQPSQKAPTFTQSELIGKTIYSATPSDIFPNPDPVKSRYKATTFLPPTASELQGTVGQVEYNNDKTVSKLITKGTYYIDNTTGVLTITLDSKTAKVSKTTASADIYNNSFIVTIIDNSDTRTEQWFFDQTIGESQAQACAKGATIPVAALPFPFKKDTVWTYKSTFANFSSTITEKVTVGGDVVGIPPQVTRSTSGTAGSTITEILNFLIINGELYSTNVNSTVGALVYPSLLSQGNSATYKTPQFDLTYSVTGQESTKVAAGTFNAWIFTISDNSKTKGTITRYYSPGIGFIKSVESDGSTTELKSYTIIK